MDHQWVPVPEGTTVPLVLVQVLELSPPPVAQLRCALVTDNKPLQGDLSAPLVSAQRVTTAIILTVDSDIVSAAPVIPLPPTLPSSASPLSFLCPLSPYVPNDQTLPHANDCLCLVIRLACVYDSPMPSPSPRFLYYIF